MSERVGNVLNCLQTNVNAFRSWSCAVGFQCFDCEVFEWKCGRSPWHDPVGIRHMLFENVGQQVVWCRPPGGHL